LATPIEDHARSGIRARFAECAKAVTRQFERFDESIAPVNSGRSGL